jgi:hypothetical protein
LEKFDELQIYYWSYFFGYYLPNTGGIGFEILFISTTLFNFENSFYKFINEIMSIILLRIDTIGNINNRNKLLVYIDLENSIER